MWIQFYYCSAARNFETGMMKKLALFAAIGLFTLAVVLYLLSHYFWGGALSGNSPVLSKLITGLRWGGTLLLAVYAIQCRSLTMLIFIGMLTGVQLGLDLPVFSRSLQLVSDIFLRLVKTVVAPLLFATLVFGIAGHANLKQVGRMGWKSLVYFEVVTTFALLIGLVCINTSKAGFGITVPTAMTGKDLHVSKPSAAEVILHIFPENIAKSIAEGRILQVVVFSVLFGIGLAMLPEATRKPLVDFTHSLAETMFKFTSIVMYLAPLAVTSAIAYTVSNLGLAIMGNLVTLLATLYIALIIFVLVVLFPVALLAGVPVLRFLAAVAEPVSIAFATSSSEAALPKAMLAMESFGVPQKIVSFVMPTGYSFNLDGGTLYLSLALVFIAQAAGKHLSFGEEVTMVLVLTLSSKGLAGIPRASFAVLSAMTASFGLPAWPIFILFGVDGLMDMARTAVNVFGNCLAAVVIARSENEFNRAQALSWPATSMVLKDPA